MGSLRTGIFGQQFARDNDYSDICDRDHRLAMRRVPVPLQMVRRPSRWLEKMSEKAPDRLSPRSLAAASDLAPFD